MELTEAQYERIKDALPVQRGKESAKKSGVTQPEGGTLDTIAGMSVPVHC